MYREFLWGLLGVSVVGVRGRRCVYRISVGIIGG